MSKATVTKLFIGSLLAIAGGLALFLIAGLLAYANSAFVMNGPDVVGIQSGGLAWTAVMLAGVGILAMAAGAMGQFTAWIGAVLNTAQLQDKTWCVVLLFLGVVSFGFIAMLFYVVAGPDGTAAVAEQPQIGARPLAGPEKAERTQTSPGVAPAT
jgi:hypothetical protein